MLTELPGFYQAFPAFGPTIAFGCGASLANQGIVLSPVRRVAP